MILSSEKETLLYSPKKEITVFDALFSSPV